ncbi:hypothetical protein [Bacillus sp. OK048]|uniref:hypothetical protein n=1 Tax=Bacillus sp. OK048 TaxID=1882761 RepID=UPI0008889955|nr:hypothetical protein [Bacillus sp. OK048]SDN74983.1 hypothetical protein SAMN05443253_11848 [Bacillus sp. OK048]
MNNRMNPLYNLFGKKRKSRGTMWASILGLGISAAVFGITRGKRKYNTQPFQNLLHSFKPMTNVNQMNNVALTEFSEELLASALENDKKH